MNTMQYGRPYQKRSTSDGPPYDVPLTFQFIVNIIVCSSKLIGSRVAQADTLVPAHT